MDAQEWRGLDHGEEEAGGGRAAGIRGRGLARTGNGGRGQCLLCPSWSPSRCAPRADPPEGPSGRLPVSLFPGPPPPLCS